MYSADKRMNSIQAGLNSLMNWTTNQIYPCLKLAHSKNGQRLSFGNKSSEMVPNEHPHLTISLRLEFEMFFCPDLRAAQR